MAIITPPARLPLRGIKWRLQTPVQINRSGWTGTSKRIGLPGAQTWSVTGEFVSQIGQDRARPWRGFFMALRGSFNSFPLAAVEKRQTGFGNPVIRAGADAGSSLPLTNVMQNGLLLRAGEVMSVPLPSGHVRLVCLSEDLVGDAAYNAVARFWPELGEVPTAGAIVEVQEPFGLVSLTSEPPGWDVDVGQTYSFSFSAEEAR